MAGENVFRKIRKIKKQMEPDTGEEKKVFDGVVRVVFENMDGYAVLKLSDGTREKVYCDGIDIQGAVIKQISMLRDVAVIFFDTPQRLRVDEEGYLVNY